jgi:hypothetical protein
MTKEEKAQYGREWRKKAGEEYLKVRREKYQKNKDNYREESKKRSRKYYYEVMAHKRAANREHYRALDKIHSDMRLKKRKDTIRMLREEGGGKCTDCGYNKYIDILQFHHHNGGKDGDVASMQSMKKMVLEAKKCILLCPNCHAIRHLTKHV